MSEENVEYKLSQFPYSLEGIARMGNLFSKQGVDNKEQEKEKTKTDIETIVTYSLGDYQTGSEATQNAEAFPTFREHPDSVMLSAMMSQMCCSELTTQKTWSALQHYIYFIYRHVVSVKPYNNSDTIPNIISRAIGEIFDSLLEADMTQVCLRLIGLLRDYVLVAKSHIDNVQSPNVASYLVTLMAYYSALCSSAGKCAPLLPEFDFLTLGRFNINWIGINKSVFYHHIYLSDNVQAKIPQFIKLHEENNPNLKGLLETYVCFTQDMQALATKWANLKMQITNASKKRARSNPKKHLLKDWKQYAEHKKIFNSPGWLNRTLKVRKIQDMNELDAHILAWVADKSAVPESLIDDKGCCLCEDCLAAEFRNNTMANALAQSFRAETSASCSISCYICHEPVVLDNLMSHIISQHTSKATNGEEIYASPFQKQGSKDSPKSRDSFLYEGLLEKNAQIKRSLLQLIEGTSSQRNKVLREKNKKDTSYVFDSKDKMFEPPNKLSNAFCGLVESEKLKHKPASRSGDTLFPFKQSGDSLFKHSKEVILKLASDSPVVPTEEEALIMEATNSSEECKMFFEHMKKLVENGDPENGKIRNKQKPETSVKNTQTTTVNKDSPKTSPTPSTTKKSAMTNTDDDNLLTCTEGSSFRKPQQKGIGNNIDSKVLEFLKNANANAQKAATVSATKSSDICTGHACGHKCKQEEELKKMTCVDTCDHHKDSRKCDCAYCEVFGSAFPPNAPKASETRDRLRTRLNQRKEKGNENVENVASKAVPATVNSRSTTKPGGNCTIKISKNTKVPLPNGKTLNVTAKVVKSVPTEPPRVPEIHHPVPPPANTKTVHVSVEVKKSNTNSEKSTATNGSKSSTSRTPSTVPEPAADVSSGCRSPSSLSTCSLFSESVDCRDINELLNYIEGNKTVDKVAIAHKKAAKKARQRSKKAQEKEEKEEKERIELENQRIKEETRLREEKLREEERRKAEIAAKQLAERQKKIKKEEKVSPKSEIKKGGKKKVNKMENNPKPTSAPKVSIKGSKLIEENIPAMVTIKRASEGANSQATVTITLKGSTPDTDKLLFTLVNGTDTNVSATSTISNTNNTKENTSVSNKSKGKNNATNKNAQPTTTKTVTENSKSSKKKKEKQNSTVTKPMKVTIAVDKNNTTKKETPLKKPAKMDTFAAHQLQQAFNNNNNNNSNNNNNTINTNKENEVTQVKQPSSVIKEEVSLNMLNLPPGITITKIDGPPSSANCKYSNTNTPHHTTHNYNYNNNYNHTPNPNPNIPSSKSGVIVVDTEKLIQQSIAASINKRDKKMSKKKREPKPPTKAPERTKVPSAPTMVTLKNPIFEAHQNNKLQEKPSFDFPSTQQASIFKGENGMVTIRSPRLQNPFETGAPVSSYFSDIQPIFSADITPPYFPMQQQQQQPLTNYYDSNNHTSQFSQYNSHYHAHEFLAGLPGIEITKISKAAHEDYEKKKPPKPVEVAPSAPPTNNIVNGFDTFNFDADEWYYESVFKPRDGLQEDMDDEEIELEEFKRFCQHSIPPPHKDKVSNLNSKEYVFNKNDVSYA